MNGTVGFPCTWSGSHDYARGVGAHRSGHYAKAVSLWKTAASKTCAIAAYNLRAMYYSGAHTPVNRPLGAAWMAVAANSRYTEVRYVVLRDTLLGKLDTAGRVRAHVDYAALRAALNLAIPQSEAG